VRLKIPAARQASQDHKRTTLQVGQTSSNENDIYSQSISESNGWHHRPAVALSTPIDSRAADQPGWDKTFPKSKNVAHRKVTFKNRLGMMLSADLHQAKKPRANWQRLPLVVRLAR
jgi:hypothetical protein